MAVADTLRIVSGPTSLAGRIQGVFTAFMAKVMAWNDAKVTRNALNALSDHELSDIGLSRADIDNVTRPAFK